jgi:hypothetical protein
MSVVKEVHHFDRNRAYVKGLDHYLEAFPWIEYNPSDTTAAFTVPLFGEATPFYLASKYSCQRISVDMPKTKMIVLLREPISRAYSEYQMKLRYHSYYTIHTLVLNISLQTSGAAGCLPTSAEGAFSSVAGLLYEFVVLDLFVRCLYFGLSVVSA